MSNIEISLKDNFGFPELKYLKFNIYLETDEPDEMMNRIKALEYCCANSPKLEEIDLTTKFYNLNCDLNDSEELFDYLENLIGKGGKRTGVGPRERVRDSLKRIITEATSPTITRYVVIFMERFRRT